VKGTFVKAAIKTLSAILLIALIALMIGGCNEKKTSQSDGSQSPAAVSDNTEQKKAESTLKVDPIESKKLNTTTTAKLVQITKIKVYFGNDQGEKLVAESRDVDAHSNLLKTAIEQLIAGPESKDLIDTIPEGTKLLNLDVINSIAYVNFSSELSSKHWGGSTMESLTIQSIVNTLTQFGDIKKVKILLDGQTAETIAGHLDISQPLTPDSSIIAP
jgi:germination protein M